MATTYTAIPIPKGASYDECKRLYAEDAKLYIEYFDAIRDHIINNKSISTQSIIEATEMYQDYYDDSVAVRIYQAVDLYRQCKEHPNNVEPNDRDFILGVLFTSGFGYCSWNIMPGGSCHDKLEIVVKFLEDNDIEVDFGRPGIAGSYVLVVEIERALKLLIPDFDYPQPPFHYKESIGKSVHAMSHMPCAEIYTKEEWNAILERRRAEREKMRAEKMREEWERAEMEKRRVERQKGRYREEVRKLRAEMHAQRA